MSSFATRDDLLARAGRLGGAFTVAGRRPNLTDIDTFVAQASDEVAEAVRAKGFDPDTVDANDSLAFTDVAAYGALARALRALGDSSSQVQELLAHAELVWAAAMGDPTSRQADAIKGSIAMGSFPAIAALLAGQGGGGVAVRAGSLWEEQPLSDAPVPLRPLTGSRATVGPAFRRGQPL